MDDPVPGRVAAVVLDDETEHHHRLDDELPELGLRDLRQRHLHLQRELELALRHLIGKNRKLNELYQKLIHTLFSDLSNTYHINYVIM